MTLNNPLGLLGLLSIPAILVLHMFRERQNRFVVSSLKPWGFLEAEVHGNKARRIPFSWLLVLDLLAATFFKPCLESTEHRYSSAGTKRQTCHPHDRHVNQYARQGCQSQPLIRSQTGSQQDTKQPQPAGYGNGDHIRQRSQYHR